MSNDKQTQRAGNNSQLLQADTIIINTGIDEVRVREICDESVKHAIEEYSAEAQAIAVERINIFTDMLISRLEKVENAFQAFSEPRFQLLLRQAQKSAACSDSEMDYELLCDLLIQKVDDHKDRITTHYISRAIDIVNEVDYNALCALTIICFLCGYTPNVGNVSGYINLFCKVINTLSLDSLPKDTEWIDHLESLGLLRIVFIDRIPVDKFFRENLSGLICAGIRYESDNYCKAQQILQTTISSSVNTLVQNELLQGYVRLPICSTKKCLPPDTSITQVLSLYDNDEIFLNEALYCFMHKMHSNNLIDKVISWWNNIPFSIFPMPLGTTLVSANMVRLNIDIL